MPEKPEVLTVAKSLKPNLLNKKVTECYVYWNNIVAYPIVSDFKDKIIGQTIHDVITRGKFIVIILDDFCLLVHLRMEGKFFFRKVGDPIEKHEHVEFILNQEISFRFHDVRKFGKMYLIKKDDVYNVKPLVDLGLEYNDMCLTDDYLFHKIHHKKLPIKTVLLDQSIIAGIGNIYDDEILFMSGINPFRQCCNVSKKECGEIIHNCNIVLDKAVALGGTTIKSFTSSEGVHGLFQNELLVHGKVGEACPNCGTTIIKCQIGGRGTYYCPKCQKR